MAMAAQGVRAKAAARLLLRSAGSSSSPSSRAAASFSSLAPCPRSTGSVGGSHLPSSSLLGSQDAPVPNLVHSRWLASSAHGDSKKGLKIVGVFYKAGDLAHTDPKFVGNVERGLDLKDWLRERGHEYVLTHDKDGENSELEKHLVDADIIITTPFHPAYITAERILKAKKLKLLLTAGVGSDHVDIRAAADAGLVVAEITGSNVVSVAEDELLRVLVLVRNFLPAWKQITEGDWNVAAAVSRSHDVEGKTIATVGAGRIGFELFKRLKPFKANLIYYDRLEWDKEKVEATGATRETDLDALLEKTDVLVLNLPLTDTTRGLFNKEKLSKLKKGSVIVNNARGSLVDAQAVVDLIKSGHLAGYSGDVWSQQPPPKDHPWRLFHGYDRLALTPHISGSTLDAQARFAAGVKDVLERWFSGQELQAKDYIVKDGVLATQYR